LTNGKYWTKFLTKRILVTLLNLRVLKQKMVSNFNTTSSYVDEGLAGHRAPGVKLIYVCE